MVSTHDLARPQCCLDVSPFPAWGPRHQRYLAPANTPPSHAPRTGWAWAMVAEPCPTHACRPSAYFILPGTRVASSVRCARCCRETSGRSACVSNWRAAGIPAAGTAVKSHSEPGVIPALAARVRWLGSGRPPLAPGEWASGRRRSGARGRGPDRLHPALARSTSRFIPAGAGNNTG